MKLDEFSGDQITVEGDVFPVYVEADEDLPESVYVDFLVYYEDDRGNRQSKDLRNYLPCAPVPPRAPGRRAFQVNWTVTLGGDPDLSGHLVQIFFRVRGAGAHTNKPVSAESPDTLYVATIDITGQDALTRIMLHEFASLQRQPDQDIRSVFDPSELVTYLATLTVQQKLVLLKTALQYPQGRLVTFVTLYPRKSLRMHADLCDANSTGIVPNATFSVFFCRYPTRAGSIPNSTSAITLVCHTKYFVVDVVNPPTRDWITRRVYDGRKPNQWLDKQTSNPVQFKLAALQPSSMCDGVIWNLIYEAGTGNNIMPGNLLHGTINTKGCWMLFRNFNWPLRLADELDHIYRKVSRTGRGKAAVVAELAKVGYDVKPGAAPSGFSDSYDKFFRYDRNWSYQWFFHEVVGIKYFGDTDTGGNKNTVNDFNVHGHEMLKIFPLDEAGKKPQFNQEDEKDLAYHDFDSHKLPIGPNLFRTNALGFTTARDFAKDTRGKLSSAQLADCTWSDLYFYKEDGLDASKLKADDVKEA